jgi:hypothetical protein
MVTPSVVTAAPSRTAAPAWAGGPRTAGWALLACASLLVLAAAFVGERSSTLAHLDADVASGEVETVQIAGGLSGDRGYAVVEVHWRRGLVGYITEVIEARPRRAAPPPASREDVTGVVTEDVGTRLTALQPDLQVDRVELSRLSSSFLGWRVPGWLAGASLVFLLATLLLLVHGPQPWRATRWAWFWLIVLTPIGAVAYLLLAGPTALVRAPRDPSKRLTGGWAFLIGLFIGTGFRSAG